MEEMVQRQAKPVPALKSSMKSKKSESTKFDSLFFSLPNIYNKFFLVLPLIRIVG
jgi:hypothetical protein